MKTDILPPNPNGGHPKKACATCGHGTAVHHPKRGRYGIVYPCNHPGCRCTKFRPVVRKVRKALA